jgi:hypothetical protein
VVLLEQRNEVIITEQLTGVEKSELMQNLNIQILHQPTP